MCKWEAYSFTTAQTLLSYHMKFYLFLNLFLLRLLHCFPIPVCEVLAVLPTPDVKVAFLSSCWESEGHVEGALCSREGGNRAPAQKAENQRPKLNSG